MMTWFSENAISSTRVGIEYKNLGGQDFPLFEFSLFFSDG